jgi:hypothetical protein
MGLMRKRRQRANKNHSTVVPDGANISALNPEAAATSFEFYHIAAARKRQQIFYDQLKKLGYVWKHGQWQRGQPVKK